ncbi:MAG: nucleotidyltransferase family protein [Deltaproteobacteria bacterium]|nr:nucleotidyltransferase family protein [Deltaproteobacteria bacterium]
MNSFQENHRLATYIIAQRVLERTAAILASAEIPVMPLKGVLLQATIYDRPWEREISDVDLLVPTKQFERSLLFLKQHGCTINRDPTGSANLRWLDMPIAVDLHKRLFPTAMFRLPTEDVFARAEPDTSICGHRIWLAHPLDTYAHIVGHFVKTRGDARDTKYFRDLKALVEVKQLDPYSCAHHLRRCGLGRAARYVLPLAEKIAGDGFSARVIQALGSDPLGDALAKGAGFAIARMPKEWFVGAIPAHLLNYSLSAGITSLYYRFVYVASYRCLTKRG